jgi:adenylate kinase family enzyme
VERVVVFGRGGAGKSTFSRCLGDATGLPVVELDEIYWGPDLRALSAEEWEARQGLVVAEPSWILDGDLGPYDLTAPRLARADTVVILDTHITRCVARALRRGARRRDFWAWTLRWGTWSRPRILGDVRRYAPGADLVILRTPREASGWLEVIRRPEDTSAADEAT